MFKDLKAQVQENFKTFGQLYVVDLKLDSLWDAYLNGFSDEAEKQHHNCNCCKSFIKNYGNIAEIKGGKLRSIWNVPTSGIYETPLKNMRNLVECASIKNVFVSSESKVGTDFNYQVTENGTIRRDHFCLDLQGALKIHPGSGSNEAKEGHYTATFQVFKRGLVEIPVHVLQTTLDLINQNSLERGAEFRSSIEKFLALKIQYDKKPNDIFIWENILGPESVLRIRNISIGTFLQDLAEGKDLDYSVEKFGKLMSPTSYKRPTSLYTPAMVKAAQEKLAELGYLECLNRRLAVKSDLEIKNLLWQNPDKVELDVFSQMIKEAPKQLSKVEEISWEDFKQKVLPTATSIEAYVESTHMPNFMTLTTSDNPKSMFKWDNEKAWYYTNDVADSLKERVKEAKGKVDGFIRISLGWTNSDDLDLHVIEPKFGGHAVEIYYASKISNRTGGQLDVDMNASTITQNPVENICYPSKERLTAGTYKVEVHNYNRRVSTNQGFTVELEVNGEIYTFQSDTNPLDKRNVTVFEFTVDEEHNVKVKGNKTGSASKWGCKINTFEKVNFVMKSPNYWGTNQGNEHVFFILENAKSDEETRGFFNEYLSQELMEQRKVFETLGSKTKIPIGDKQLSGLGFTKGKSLTVQVKGTFNRVLKINF